MMSWDIKLPFKKLPLSLNDRMHWAQKNKITKQLRMIGRTKSRMIPDLPRCRVELIWYVNTRHRRDVDNAYATLKPLADGLVDAEIVPDDTPEWMEKLVRIEYRPGQDAGMVLRVTELPKGTTE